LTDDRVERRLAAVLAADVAGYSRLMGIDEEGTLSRLKAIRKSLVDPAIASHRGRIVKTTGDGMLVEFASAVDAVRCATAIQRDIARQNHGLPQDTRLEFRVGIHVGDIITDDNDIFGDGVNIAARLEGIAEPGGICISDDAYRQVRAKVDAAWVDLGPQKLKNISEPMRSWRIEQDVHKAVARSRPDDNTALALPDKPSIAVLPFQNMSGDQEQEYFADGTVEDIITALSRSKLLFVVSRNSTFTYKGRAVDIRQVSRELGVRYVLEGSVRKSGKRVRVTAQLIDASTDAHIWADRFDSDLEDVFDLQDRITSSVIGAISPRLERAELERAQRKPTENLRAYDYYLRAQFSLYHQSRESNIEALGLAKIAISLDPNYALAHAFAANIFGQRKAFGWSVDPAQDRLEAHQFAERSLQLDKDDALVLAFAGQTISFVLEEVEKGVAILARAVALDPNLVAARNWYGWSNLYLGNIDVAIEQLNASLRLSPLDPRLFIPLSAMSYAHFFAGRYEEGIAWGKCAMQIQSNFPGGPRSLMANLAMAGRIAEAQQVCAESLRTNPNYRISQIKQMTPYRRAEFVEKLGHAFRLAGLPE
jgi:TolB-like protein/class 3 adenylate cyclase